MKRIIIIIFVVFAFSYSCVKDDGESGVSTGGDQAGQAGSMAKFSINNNHLYVINKSKLKTYDISNASQPQLINDLTVNFGIETVFTLGEHLFIGSVNGLYIYDVSDPNNIKFLSYYQHITSCDPVVANDSLAFVTLNSSASCWWNNGANRLDVLSIENKIDPELLSSVNMASPKGLGIKDHYVYVCNESQGLSVFDFSNPYNLSEVANISGIYSYDVIIRDNLLYLIGKDGLFQYDISDVNNISLISNMLFQ